MSKPNDGGPVFPLDPKNSVPRFGGPDPHAGISLRDFFAAHTAGGLVTRPGFSINATDSRNIAVAAYMLADAMLAAREGTS